LTLVSLLLKPLATIRSSHWRRFPWPLPPLRRKKSARYPLRKGSPEGVRRAHRAAGEEKKTIADDIRDVYAEAKGNGFDVKALRTIVRLRKQDADERREHETILETYMHALGMLN
jgi:uncharacterized protein (UPF0335 family)